MIICSRTILHHHKKTEQANLINLKHLWMLKDKVITLPKKKKIDKDVGEIFFTRNLYRNALSYQEKKPSVLVKAVFVCSILKSQLA